MKEERLYSTGGSRHFRLGGGGGGGIQTLVQKGLLNVLWQITSPHTPSHQSQLHVIIPWPLDTVYLNSTRKGRTLGTSFSCSWQKRLYMQISLNIPTI